MGPYIFVLAAVLAIIPILIIFKITMERIKEDPTQRTKAQTHFFIGTALSETIPIILIIYGFSNITTVSNIDEVYLPGIIILLMVGFATLFIFLQRTIDVEENTKEVVNAFAMMGLGITNAIPIMAIVGLFMMIP